MSARQEAAAIILAAGEGRRMGGVVKALLRLPSGETFLERILAAARAVPIQGNETVVVYASAHPFRVPGDALTTGNPRPEEGMLSSLQWGLRALVGPRTPADNQDWDPPPVILLWPVDAPRVPVEVLRRVIDAVEGHVDVALPVLEGRGGHPAAFSKRLIGEILAAPPTASTRDVLRAPGRIVRRVEVAAPEVLDDVDTEEAYRALLEGEGKDGRPSPPPG